jgi:hypothetical protein
MVAICVRVKEKKKGKKKKKQSASGAGDEIRIVDLDVHIRTAVDSDVSESVFKGTHNTSSKGCGGTQHESILA